MRATKKMKIKKRAGLLHFGARGHTIHASSETCQGYEDPESFVRPYHWWAHPPEQMSLHWDSYEIPAEGVAVVDVRAAIETPEGYSWVFKGPLVDVDLADDQVNECPMPSPILAFGLAQSGYGLLLADHVVAKNSPQRKRSSLDSVSVSEYINGWREHGARIGRFFVRNGAGVIEWEVA